MLAGLDVAETYRPSASVFTGCDDAPNEKVWMSPAPSESAIAATITAPPRGAPPSCAFSAAAVTVTSATGFPVVRSTTRPSIAPVGRSTTRRASERGASVTGLRMDSGAPGGSKSAFRNNLVTKRTRTTSSGDHSTPGRHS